MNPELKNKNTFKVGDKVKVINIGYPDKHVGIIEDETYTVVAISGNTPYIRTPINSSWPMYKNQLRLEENVKMQEYKIGEMIKVIELINDTDRRNFKLNGIYKVVDTNIEGWPRIQGTNSFGDPVNYAMKPSQIELVDMTKSMTFPEIAEMVINGLIADGTELTMTDYDGDTEAYFVIKGDYGYGITAKQGRLMNSSLSFPSRMNGTWKLAEKVKEMSIEELQKELGYKIKIVKK